MWLGGRAVGGVAGAEAPPVAGPAVWLRFLHVFGLIRAKSLATPGV
ncbi:hypothetical protein CBOVI_07435 [Corynebacterium bovis DSM 20582 = CIP 54.80]|uniref:Uncharacterized protein n=1 Tax=Corynebacterium bovis DSM 20582 = CIP 54.80 TaxID=927655 RepID=A0A8H9Y985_9CORY|nr:hypothetical protein [Corynebacterium bovis DSM 20582 = CIP 54.80]WJY77993.1 hypothetical protein CBOVI_07435 [Corynebacterium bovis DSM 20582 = CIP 54.80]